MKWKQFFIGVLIDFRVVRGKVSQRMEEHPDAKWKLPGWRIEQRYATDVLIGNWNEERRVVCKKISFPQLSGETWGELEQSISFEIQRPRKMNEIYNLIHYIRPVFLFSECFAARDRTKHIRWSHFHGISIGLAFLSEFDNDFFFNLSCSLNEGPGHSSTALSV